MRHFNFWDYIAVKRGIMQNAKNVTFCWFCVVFWRDCLSLQKFTTVMSPWSCKVPKTAVPLQSPITKHLIYYMNWFSQWLNWVWMTQGSQSTLCVMSPDSHNLDESLKEPFTAIASEITQSVCVRERRSFLSHTKVLSSCLTGLKNLCE